MSDYYLAGDYPAAILLFRLLERCHLDGEQPNIIMSAIRLEEGSYKASLRHLARALAHDNKGAS